MKNILMIYVYLSIVLIIASAQETQIISTMIFTPQINQDYSIVHSFLYPSSSQSIEPLPKDYYVNKLINMNLTLNQQPQQKASSPAFISFENSLTKQIPIVNKFSNIPPIQNYNAILNIYPAAAIPARNVEQKQSIVDFTNHNQEQKGRLQPFKDISNSKKQVQTQQLNRNPQKLENPIQNSHQILSSANQKQKNIQSKQEKILDNNLQGQVIKKQNEPQSALGIKRPLLYNSPLKSKQQQVENPKAKGEPKQDKYLLNEIEQLRKKNHKWSILIIILFIAVIFLVFLLMRFFSKNKSENLNKRLGDYRLASNTANDEQQQCIANKMSEQIEGQQY